MRCVFELMGSGFDMLAGLTRALDEVGDEVDPCAGVFIQFAAAVAGDDGYAGERGGMWSVEVYGQECPAIQLLARMRWA